MKASYSTRPSVLELMPDGHHLFRFDIEEVVNGENTQFLCREVQIFGAVTSSKLTEAAITEKWGNGVENKLINEYNEFKAGLSEDSNAETRYVIFLAERKALKEYINSIV